MRMGKPDKRRRGTKTLAEGKKKPKNSSLGSVIGELSPDIISTYLGPKLIELATKNLEDYSDELLRYEDIVKDIEKLKQNATIEAENGSDATIINEDMELPDAPKAPLYRSQYWIDELSEVIKETSEHFQSKNGGWKVRAKAAKFERQLDEKYGVFRPFITKHPELEQFVRNVQRKYAKGYFSPFRQGKPPIPKTTAVIILFMMQRGNMGWEVLVLSILFFLVGLQPWALVVLIAGGHNLLSSRKKRPLSPTKTFIPAVEPYYERSGKQTEIKKESILSNPVGTPLNGNEKVDVSLYDTMILGDGPESLYAAALLSKAGRKVLVLSPRQDASGCFEMSNDKFKGIPFDVESSNIARIQSQQSLLAPALCTSNDYQGGIRFAQIGSQADGYAFEIISVPGMGTDSINSEIPFILKAAGGTKGLMEDAASYLGDGWPDIDGSFGNSATGAYLSGIAAMNASSMQYYLTKILPDSVNDMRSNSSYHESAVRYTSSFLDKCFPLNAHPRSLMAAMGMKGENISPNSTSMGAHVTNVCAAVSGDGMHYPIGGPRALCHAFASVVEQLGGRIVTGVQVTDLLFGPENKVSNARTSSSTARSNDNTDDILPAPRCVGVKIDGDKELKFSDEQVKNKSAPPVVISMVGFTTTFIRLLPEGIRVKYKVPRGLPALSERRPVFKCLFMLRGTAQELNVTGADYYRLPNAALAQDEVDPTTGQVRLGQIGYVNDDRESSSKEGDDGKKDEISTSNVNDNNDKEPADSATTASTEPSKAPASKPTKQQKVKFDTGKSWLQIAFPSAKDPTFESRHGKLTTCVVTIEADDDFVSSFDTKPKLFVVQKPRGGANEVQQRLVQRITNDLLNIYPQLEGKIGAAQLVGPLYRGLSHNPERYAAKGIRADTPYPGLFMGGSDLTIGESFSASIVGSWLVCNAVMGYSAIDLLYLEKNITSDLEQFMERPTLPDDDDYGTSNVAVPYKPHVQEQEQQLKMANASNEEPATNDSIDKKTN